VFVALYGKSITEAQSIIGHMGPDHTVLPATHCSQVYAWFTYPKGMEGWVDLGVGCIL